MKAHPKGVSTVDAVVGLVLATLALEIVMTLNTTYVHTLIRVKTLASCGETVETFTNGYRSASDLVLKLQVGTPLLIQTRECRLEVLTYDRETHQAKVKITSLRKKWKSLSTPLEVPLDLRE